MEGIVKSSLRKAFSGPEFYSLFASGLVTKLFVDGRCTSPARVCLGNLGGFLIITIIRGSALLALADRNEGAILPSM